MALGFLPSAGPSGGSGSAPPPSTLISGDPGGLDALPGLSGIYRTDTWLAEVPAGRLQSWNLGPLERRLQQVSAESATVSGAFTVTAPFAGLDAARAQVDAAPRRLLLAGGAAVAALGAFVILAASALRRDMSAELARMQTAGARPSQRVLLGLSEAAALSTLGILSGALAGVVASAGLADGAGLPVGGVLVHSLLTTGGLGVAMVGWVVVTARGCCC